MEEPLLWEVNILAPAQGRRNGPYNREWWNALSWQNTDCRAFDPLDNSEGHRVVGYEMVSVEDIALMKDPDNSKSRLVRRLAAVGGYEMVSTDEKEDPFVLQQDECWVLSDNEALKPMEAKDSRTFGPVQMSNIMGRVIYCMRNAKVHGPVQNSSLSMREDAPVLEVELDVKKMAKNHKKST